jgi:vitamin B12 transporter
VPTARAGIRKDLGDGLYLRTAAYIGFRSPSLNELYRPFRLGNNATLANPDLRPERLGGAEVGIGGEHGMFSWDGTAYWNQLQDAITNVTIGTGPQTVPGIGAIPAGGSIIQRQNVGDIQAFGVEAESHLRLSDMLSFTAALDLADSRVEGGTQAPQLTGKRPAQAPRWTVTGGFVATPLPDFSISAMVRYESMRFADDLNTLRLAPATTLDVKAAWNITHNLAAYVAVDNLLDANVATNEDTTGVFSYDAPRLYRVGLSWVQ